MKGKIILVTGGSGGIGRAIVDLLAEQEATICLQYSNNQRDALMVKGTKKNIHLFHQDFLSKDINLIDRIISSFGRIDCLVNCAGVMSNESIFEMTHEGFDRLFSINTKIPFMLSSQAFNEMKKHKYGRIINISSFVIKYGMGRNQSIQYAASKAALESLTTGLSRLGAEHNILVNTIRPGLIQTSMQEDRPDMEHRINMIPVKRMGLPIEIANMVQFLLSKSGDFITGETITVSGGE